jgi:uncharacterized repeat protein (TIGR04138 family)
MQEIPFADVVRDIREKDPRYETEAYFFIRNALDFTAKLLGKPRKGPDRHITGQELLEGIRTYVLQEFGPMAVTVLGTWGVKTTEDFGELVFNLVDAGVLGRTQRDNKKDFAGGYDFGEAFSKPFLPASARSGSRPPKTSAAKRRAPVRKKP